MIGANGNGVQVWVATTPLDMRKSFDGLAEVVRAFLGHDPRSGNLFVFRNRSGQRVKVLWWDRNGLALCYKRIEQGTFPLPAPLAAGDKAVAIFAAELAKLLADCTPQSPRKSGGFGACQALRFRGRRGTPAPAVSDGIDQLPDDPALLKRLIAESRQAVAERDAAIAEREARIERLRAEAAEQMEAFRLRMEAEHRAAIDAILRRFYGPRSEAFDPTQLLMFGITVAPQTPIDPASDEATAAGAESGQKLASRRINHHKHGRRKLPEHLPRRRIVHDLTDEQKRCPCCGEQRSRIGSETSEQLEYIPAKFEVLQHVRHKYACKVCGEGKCPCCDGRAHVDIATKEAGPVEKGLPGPSLVAYVITSKLGDHLPLYRLETIFDRSGIDIARSTMCTWMLAAGRLVKPLTDLMADRVRTSRVIHTDETRVPVQDGSTPGRCKSGRIWTYVGDESNPYVVYDYTPDRTRAGPMAWLGKFSAYLQADAYGGYDGVYATGGVTEVACWAHARRKFFDARKTDGARAAQMLESLGGSTPWRARRRRRSRTYSNSSPTRRPTSGTRSSAHCDGRRVNRS